MQTIDHQPNTILSFPPDFLWGSATSSYQVEGDCIHADWHEWEKTPGRIKKNQNCGKTCHHYYEYKNDFILLEKLHHNAYRMSLEWSRIEPRQGRFQEDVLVHYRDMLKMLKQRNITIFLTLHHFTLPQWIAEQGGFGNKLIIERFEKYVKRVLRGLADCVDFWITINEPMGYWFHGYFEGDFPPCKKAHWKNFNVINNILMVHAKAYHAIHEYYGRDKRDVKVGIAKHMAYIEPYRIENHGDRTMARLLDFIYNHLFLKVLTTGILLPPLALFKKNEFLKNTLDFVGLNYYTREFVACNIRNIRSFGIDRKVGLRLHDMYSDMNWEIYPHGLYMLIHSLKKYNLPIYITENGIADGCDDRRYEFIISHLREVYRAIKEGIDVKGYLYWSLLDNFEWTSGFAPRFGLIEVDYATQERKIRESARRFAVICRENKIAITS